MELLLNTLVYVQLDRRQSRVCEADFGQVRRSETAQFIECALQSVLRCQWNRTQFESWWLKEILVVCHHSNMGILRTCLCSRNLWFSTVEIQTWRLMLSGLNTTKLCLLLYIFTMTTPLSTAMAFHSHSNSHRKSYHSTRWSHYPKLGTWPRLPTHNSLWHQRGR